MGKLLDLLKGVSLPPEIESQVRIYDLQHEDLQKKYDELIQEVETVRVKEDDKTGRADQLERAQEVPRYTTQRMTHPDDPTEEEAMVLKLLQPQGRKVSADTIAEHLGVNLGIVQNCMNQLKEKGHLHRHIHRGSYGRRAQPNTYSLTDKGLKYLIDHNLVQ